MRLVTLILPRRALAYLVASPVSHRELALRAPSGAALPGRGAARGGPVPPPGYTPPGGHERGGERRTEPVDPGRAHRCGGGRGDLPAGSGDARQDGRPR